MYIKNLLLVCCASLSIAVIPSYAETLEGAVQKTLEVHPGIDAALAALDVAKNQRQEYVSSYFPRVSASATGGRIFGDNATSRGLTVSRGAAYSYLWEGSLSASQLIFDGFETRNRVDSADAQRLAADLRLQDTQETLSFSAAQAYIDLLRVRKGIVLINQQIETTQDYLSRIEQALEDGVADEAEAQRAQDILSNLMGLLVNYQGQEAAVKAQYIEFVGALPESALENPRPISSFIEAEAEQAVEIALSEHLSIKAAQMAVKSAQYDVSAEKGQLYPDVNGELSYLKSDKREEIGGEVEDARAVVRMNWDFETGLGQYARINQRKNRHREARARLEEIKQQVAKGVRLSYAEHQTSVGLLANLSERAALAQDLYQTYQVQFEGALVRVIDLMQAENQYFLAKLEQLNGSHRALLSQYGIMASMGRLQPTLAENGANAR